MKTALFEGLIVASIGVVVSFAANHFSPRGLKLSRDYFPAAIPESPTSSNTFATPSPTNTLSSTEQLELRLRARGLSLVDSNQVTQLFRDPRYQQELVIFIDARDEEHYAAGHIPGAFHLDYYRPEKQLPTVLQAAQFAQEIVFYCNGGNCEDSEFAATMLASALPGRKLLVYGGGMAEWATNGLPVEIGPRKSGILKGSQS